MSKERELTIDELDAVSGGANACGLCIPVPMLVRPEGGGGGGGGVSDGTMISYGRANAGAIR